jgi:7-cyano-7-deazaguanine synthase in queuosine biosynthesis
MTEEPALPGGVAVVRPTHRVLLLLSGGLDSSVLGAWLLKQRFDVHAIHIEFGQSNAPCEREAASAVWNNLRPGAPLSFLNLTVWRNSFPAGVSMATLPRNALFVLACVPHARARHCAFIATGSTADDRAAPDSNDDFVSHTNDYLAMLRQPERVVAPFLLDRWGKTQIASWALKHVGSEFVGLTHSCWRNKPGGCGECNACHARQMALEPAANLSAS